MKIVNNVDPPAGLEAQLPGRHWRWFVSWLTVAIDFVVVFAAVVCVSVSYHMLTLGFAGSRERMIELAVTLSFIFVFTNLLQRRYKIGQFLTVDGQLIQAFNAWNVSMFAFAAVSFLTKVIDNYSRAVIVITYVAGIVLVPLTRHLISRLISVLTKTGRIGAQRVLLIGRNADVVAFMTRHQPWNNGLVIQEMLIFDEGAAGATTDERDERLSADIAFAVGRARAAKPDAIVIALPWSERALIDRCVEAFMTVPVSISLAPEEIIERFEKPRIARMGAISILELQPAPFTSTDLVAKRIFDFVMAIAGLLACAPLFAVVAILIKLDSRGPVLFFQRRYGFNQEPFRIVKFRTMTSLDDGDVVVQAQRSDGRITRVGAWLRRWNIDELPQLLNVLQGRMSLVGPRPHALAHDRQYEQKIALYARRHNVKPGITGWAQVNGFRGQTDTDDKMARRVAHDLWYIDNWTFWLDIAILFRTIFSRKAYRNAV
jgi:Undecaprenyl-phosphate glucose phosphotransferase